MNRNTAIGCLQDSALEPEWEAPFEPKSYGFRPGRGCHDAIQRIFTTAHGKSARRCWVLDADLAGAFDRIDHSHLLSALGTLPARELIERRLKAGVVEQARFAPTEEGTPQGGVMPWTSVPAAVGGQAWAGRVVIDATNALLLPEFRPAPLDGRTSSEIVAELVPGARLVKAGNTLSAELLGADPADEGGRRVIFSPATTRPPRPRWRTCSIPPASSPSTSATWWRVVRCSSSAARWPATTSSACLRPERRIARDGY
jgi:hypothetical protein